jgi:hypothetical protein
VVGLKSRKSRDIGGRRYEKEKRRGFMVNGGARSNGILRRH